MSYYINKYSLKNTLINRHSDNQRNIWPSLHLFPNVGGPMSWMTVMTFILENEESFLEAFLSSFQDFYKSLDPNTLFAAACQ